jgi:hypothetical protein
MKRPDYEYYLKAYTSVASGATIDTTDFDVEGVGANAAMALGVHDAKTSFAGQTVTLNLFAPRSQVEITAAIAALIDGEPKGADDPDGPYIPTMQRRESQPVGVTGARSEKAYRLD